jgi:hypothetical protein
VWVTLGSDGPRLIPAKITDLASQSAGALVSYILYLYYRWANARKDRSTGPPEGSEIGQWENLTDEENSSFRYVY